MFMMYQQSGIVLQFELIQLRNIMKPRRPDSAKSHVTKITQDSEFSKKELNFSKFSETFSSGVNSTHEKGDQFKQYVEQKNKDPRFKHLKPKLQVIQQKSSQPEPSKANFKPFQKKKDKTVEKNSNKKIEQKVQKIERDEEQLTLSRGFAEKNKQKMNSLKQTLTQKQQQAKVKEAIKSKIKFDAFRINKPGEKRQIKKAAEVEQKKQQTIVKQKQEVKPQVKPAQRKKNQKTEQQVKRQSEYRDLQRYVNDVQARNFMNFPTNYDRFVNQVTPDNVQDLTKINLNDFMNDPTEGDYEKLKAKIQKFDTQLDSERAEESIDLESLIQSQQKEQEESQANELIYASMSASDIKKRNAFITQVLSGKISKNEINKLEQMEKTSIRMYKLEHQKEEEDVEFSEINMVKRNTNRLMERNRLQAAGQLYRDCDYLSEEHKQRLQELLNGDIGSSPFEFDQLEGMRRRRIDEGIRMYRQMSGSNQTNNEIFNEESLPKDPQLRKQAEKKVLKQKITNVNQRLSQVDKVIVTKAKIQALLKKFEHTRTSSNYQQFYQQNQQKFEEQMRMLAEAQDMVKDLSNKQNIDEVIDEIQAKYKQLQEQIRRFTQMDEKQLMRLEKQKLRAQMREVQKIQRQAEQFDQQLDEIQRIKKEIQGQLKVFDQIQDLHAPQIQCEGYKQSETLEDLDAIITKKWKAQLNNPNQFQSSE